VSAPQPSPPRPRWGRIWAVTGGPRFFAAPASYAGRPLYDLVAEHLDRYCDAARADPANGHLSDFELEAAVALTVFGPNRLDPPEDVWDSVVAHVLGQTADNSRVWEEVLLFACGRGRERRPMAASDRPWSRRSSFALQQLREFVREPVRYGVGRLVGWGKLRFADDDDRAARVDDLVEVLTLSLIAGDCECAAMVPARHGATRAARCSREHAIDGWRLGGVVTVGRAAMQAVVGTVQLRPAIAPWFARGMLFVALEEVIMGPVAFWRCHDTPCASLGSHNYYSVVCVGPCGMRLDAGKDRVFTEDDQLVNIDLGTRVPFFRCRCQNLFRVYLGRPAPPACPLCGANLRLTSNGRLPRPKLAWI